MTSIKGAQKSSDTRRTGAQVIGYVEEPLLQLETDRREERQEKGRLKYEKIQK